MRAQGVSSDGAHHGGCNLQIRHRFGLRDGERVVALAGRVHAPGGIGGQPPSEPGVVLRRKSGRLIGGG
eukprot:4670759-Alexandrium_andersonii.AAC.1